MALRGAVEADDVPDAVEWQAGGRRRRSAEGKGAGFRLEGREGERLKAALHIFILFLISFNFRIESCDFPPRATYRNNGWSAGAPRVHGFECGLEDGLGRLEVVHQRRLCRGDRQQEREVGAPAEGRKGVVSPLLTVNDFGRPPKVEHAYHGPDIERCYTWRRTLPEEPLDHHLRSWRGTPQIRCRASAGPRLGEHFQ